MKKMIFVLAAVMVLGLTACSTEKEVENNSITENMESTENSSVSENLDNQAGNNTEEEIPDGIEVIDSCIDYFEYEGQKIYLVNDLAVFLKQFEGTDYVCTSDRVEKELNEEFYAELEGADYLALQLKNKKDYSYASPVLTVHLDRTRDYVDAEGNTIPYFWYISKGNNAETTKVSIKGTVYDFGKESIHIDELIAVFGEEYQTDTDISGTKYYWKDENYTYSFVTYSKEEDENYKKVKSINLNLR